MTKITINPIPDSLLGDSFSLIEPNKNGFERTEISNVRIDRTSAVSDYSSQRMRDTTELSIIFDCENSLPKYAEFCAGQQAEYCGETFEIVEVKLYSSDKPHHYTLKAKKTGGSFTG
jgi:hypothetical protein